MSDETYYRKDWMGDEEWECAEFLADVYHGFHHIPGDLRPSGKSAVCLEVDHISLATFDFNEMTRIVVLSHDKCIRFGVSGPRMEEREYEGHTYEAPVMTIVASKRQREGQMYQRHPTLEDATAEIRGTNTPPADTGEAK